MLKSIARFIAIASVAGTTLFAVGCGGSSSWSTATPANHTDIAPPYAMD